MKKTMQQIPQAPTKTLTLSLICQGNKGRQVGVAFAWQTDPARLIEEKTVVGDKLTVWYGVCHVWVGLRKQNRSVCAGRWLTDLLVSELCEPWGGSKGLWDLVECQENREAKFIRLLFCAVCMYVCLWMCGKRYSCVSLYKCRGVVWVRVPIYACM